MWICKTLNQSPYHDNSSSSMDGDIQVRMYILSKSIQLSMVSLLCVANPLTPCQWFEPIENNFEEITKQQRYEYQCFCIQN